LGAKDLINNVEPIILNGGTFSTGESTGFDETVSTLALTENSGIHLGTGAHSLHFSASNGVGWTAGKTLTITGWTGTAGSSGTAGKIYFGASTGTLTEAQLSQISFNGYNGTPILLSTGELVPNVGTPVITVGTVSDFGNQCINTASEIQSYTISGTSLTSPILKLLLLQDLKFQNMEVNHLNRQILLVYFRQMVQVQYPMFPFMSGLHLLLLRLIQEILHIPAQELLQKMSP
jgi:hypothetical protein